MKKHDVTDKADNLLRPAVGLDPVDHEAMEQRDPVTEDVLCIQHIHSIAGLELGPSAAAADSQDDHNLAAGSFPKLYHARSRPCSVMPASLASWSPCPAT